MLDGLTPTLHAGGKHIIMLGDGRIDRMMDEDPDPGPSSISASTAWY